MAPNNDVLLNEDDMMEDQSNKTPLLNPFRDTESHDHNMIIRHHNDGLVLDDNNNEWTGININHRKTTDNNENSVITSNDHRVMYEHDRNKLRDYYYETIYGNRLLMYIRFINYISVFLFFSIDMLNIPSTIFRFLITIIWLLLFYIIFLLLLYPIILKVFRSCCIHRIIVNQWMETFITPNGIGYIQSHIKNNESNKGGEIFIPFHNIEDVNVSMTSTTYAVTKVDIKLKRIEPNHDDVCRFIVNGYPSFHEYNKRNHQYKIEIFGLINPYNLKCAIMEKLPSPPPNPIS